MRILYIDIDSLRPDHLGCYGYHRHTSPNIDRIARQGVIFDNVYTSDAPCLPSRTALWSGRFGIHNGIINHGGAAAELFSEGSRRGFASDYARTNWMRLFRQAGYRTATVSPFGERHSAWHWYANFNDITNTGANGLECADEIIPHATRWLMRYGQHENWFLHVNLWDPHTPYRTPENFGNPFVDTPLPAWLNEMIRAEHWQMAGPHSAQEVNGFSPEPDPQYPRQPARMAGMDDVRAMFDGYDCGVRYADEWIGRLLNTLADRQILDDTAVIISADHGENLGELNVYGDHQTADHCTCRVPLIMRWPGLPSGRKDHALHYLVDIAATITELIQQQTPCNWDARSFAEALRQGLSQGRESLIISQGAWACQRGVRFQDHLYIRTYHDAFHGYPDAMLFDVKTDPHEQHDLAPNHPELVASAAEILKFWHAEMMRTSVTGIDPMWTVLAEGGGLHVHGELPAYLARLEKTGRRNWADSLRRTHRTRLQTCV